MKTSLKSIRYSTRSFHIFHISLTFLPFHVIPFHFICFHSNDFSFPFLSLHFAPSGFALPRIE